MTCMLFLVIGRTTYSHVCVVYDNGETQTFNINPERFFFGNWHKIGHIGKFAEALKELEKMAKSGGD